MKCTGRVRESVQKAEVGCIWDCYMKGDTRMRAYRALVIEPAAWRRMQHSKEFFFEDLDQQMNENHLEKWEEPHSRIRKCFEGFVVQNLFLQLKQKLVSLERIVEKKT